VNLPAPIAEELKKRGFRYLTPPQAEAVRRGLTKFRNVVVSSPTASGKTLVAEIALVNAFLNGFKGLYATPLKTLANEKFEEFSLWGDIGLRVGITTGDYDEPGEWLSKYDVIVATYERLDSILRLKPTWLSKVGTLVVDELHTIGDSDRGPVVELLAARALSMGMQVVGLSATIGNPEEIAEWLNAELVASDWRPVELIEGFYSRRRKLIRFSDGRTEPVNGDIVTHVVRGALIGDYQVIIFRQSRRKAEKTAYEVANLLPTARRVKELAKELEEHGSPSCEVISLSPLLSRGAAFHHAGLSHASRAVVERLFRDGAIRVVVATPTLAAGVNMPARRVLIFTRRYEGGYMRPISVAEYKQMAGRAGRPQYDPFGEAIVADVKSDSEGWKYVKGVPEGVRSALISERALRIHTLALIASGYASNLRDLFNFMSKTLAFHKANTYVTVDEALERVIDSLIEMGMVVIRGLSVEPTKLGSCVSKLYIDPLTATIVLDNLRGRGEVHALYYLTLLAMTPDFSRVRVIGYKGLASEAEAAFNSGLIPGPTYGSDYYDWLRAYKVALIMNEWLNEVSEDRIVEIHNVGAGDLAAISDTMAWLTYSASRVAEVAGLRHHFKVLNRLSYRVRYGVKEELLDLVRIRYVGRVRARILYDNGYKTVSDVATADPERLSKLPTLGSALAKEIVAEARRLLARTY